MLRLGRLAANSAKHAIHGVTIYHPDWDSVLADLDADIAAYSNATGSRWTMPEAIHFDSVCVDYGRTRALSDYTLNVGAGEAAQPSGGCGQVGRGDLSVAGRS